MLPLLHLKGKEYLQVPHRLVWFREERPLWRIETQLLEHSGKHAISRAVIRDENGNIMSTAHKSETVEGFADFIEKSETGAIGRALLMIGYGTAFCADELFEGTQRIVDSPVDPVGLTKIENQAAAASMPQVSSQKVPAKTLYPSLYPEHLAKRFIEDFGTDELLQASDSLAKWKSKGGSAFKPIHQQAYDYIVELMTPRTNDLDQALARNS